MIGEEKQVVDAVTGLVFLAQQNEVHQTAGRRALGSRPDDQTLAAGGIGTFEEAEGILQREEADIIGAARQNIADPDWFLKVKVGRGEEIRRCEYTNYCEGLDQNHKQVTCKLWDRKELDEDGVRMDHSGKRRLVAPAWKR